MKDFLVLTLLGTLALSSSAFAQTSVTPMLSEGRTGDLFDYAIIDSSSAVIPGFSIQDAFGAVTSDPRGIEALAGGHVIFDDAVLQPFIDFHTLTPITLAGFDLFLTSDWSGNPYRGFSAVSLFSSDDNGQTFGNLLGSASYDPSMGAVRVSGTFAPTTAQFFRFEGVAANGGARLVELDAVAGVPEPATWGMMIAGFAAVGFAMRRRQRLNARVKFA